MVEPMKSQTPGLMKFKRLQRVLGETKRGTVGLLELLWIETIGNCPDGDIGRFSDDEISIMCDWEGDAAAMIEALVETGWLDRSEKYRLVVHDWHEHVPNYLRGAYAKHNKRFASECAEQHEEQPAKQEFSVAETVLSSSDSGARTAENQCLLPNLTNSILTNPNQSNISAIPSSEDSAKEPKDGKPPTNPRNTYPNGFMKFWDAFPILRRTDKPGAFRAWERAIKKLDASPDGPANPALFLLIRARDYARSEKGQGQYVRGPIPWLNQEAWNDDPETWKEPDGKPKRRRSSARYVPGS